MQYYKIGNTIYNNINANYNDDVVMYNKKCNLHQQLVIHN